MADDQVTLNFNNDVFTIVSGSDAGQQANYSGSVMVDYTTGTYSGLNFKVQGFGNNSGFGDSGGNYGGTLGVGGDNYAVTGGGFTLNWTGMTPSNARARLVANNNDTYDTQSNAANQQSQPVSTTVNSTSSSSDPTVCFCAGTRIATVRGEVAVEDLAVGDLVVNSTGTQKRVRWIGHRAFDCRRHPRPHEIMPVRIAAHAIAPGRPARDLRLSPGHSICIDAVGELLVPASSLINGATIVQEDVDHVTYWHVELETHDVIVAEGLTCESYLDMGNRTFFSAEDTVVLHGSPDAIATTHADFCRPFVASGPIVDFLRERLAERAASLGWSLREDAMAGLHLVVDGARLEPEVQGLSARFHLPAAAKEVWLVSRTNAPCRMGMSSDQRELGVCLKALTVDDGFERRDTTIEDSCLCVGFHAIEDGPQRWTAGRARLPAILWDGCRGSFFLRVDLARPALPRWEAMEADELAAVTA